MRDVLSCRFTIDEKKVPHTYLYLKRAVVPANVDVATQEIVQLAEDADPKGKRTLGVITKPDLVDKGAEDKVVTYRIRFIPIGSCHLGNRSHRRPRTLLCPGIYHRLQQESE